MDCFAGKHSPQTGVLAGHCAPFLDGFETLLDIPVDGLRNRSLQWWVAQLPVQLGGLGVRLQTPLSPMSYLGSVEKCVPSFTSSNLAHLFEEGEPDNRQWARLVDSGSKLGAEFVNAWNTVRREAVHCCNFLGEALPEIFSPIAEASEWVLRQVQGRKWWRAGSSCWQPPWQKG